jgi:hypothetical protein
MLLHLMALGLLVAFGKLLPILKGGAKRKIVFGSYNLLITLKSFQKFEYSKLLNSKNCFLLTAMTLTAR